MKTEVINSMEIIDDILKYNKIKSVDHVFYDKSVNDNFDQEITMSCAHDGTFLFRKRLLDEVLVPLINKRVIEENRFSDEEVKKIKDIKYIIGDLIIESEYGVKIKDFVGMRDTVKLPVKFEYIF